MEIPGLRAHRVRRRWSTGATSRPPATRGGEARRERYGRDWLEMSLVPVSKAYWAEGDRGGRNGGAGVSERPERGGGGAGTRRQNAFLVENDEALAALVNLIAVMGDNVYFLGRRVSEWADAGPLLESTAACAAITQDKLGQSRAIYPLLEDLPWPNPPTGLQGEVDRARRYSVSFLDDPLPSWTNVVAALALVGPAVNTVLKAVEHSATRRSPGGRTASSTRRLTSAHAESLVRQIAYEERGRNLFQERVDELLPEMLCWFGPDGEDGIEALRLEGLIGMGNEEMRQSIWTRSFRCSRNAE